MAHQGTRYTLENKSLCKPATPNKVGKVPFTPKDSLRPPLRKAPALGKPLATSQHYRDRRFDVSKLLRIHSYHLLASASPFSNQAQALDVSITARGLHGEAYRGHIFWDEILFYLFIFNIILTQRNNCCCIATTD